MERESFVFYRSFAEQLRKLPAEQYKRIMNSIFDYALDGVVGDMDTIDGIIFGLIKPQLDANNQRYQNGCKGAEYGKLGGRPKKPQENPKETPNDNDNVNDNENVNDKERERDAHPRTLTHEEEKFYQFLDWCKVYASDSLRFTEPLTFDNFWWLYSKYGAQKMKECASDLHNKGAYKRNKNAMNCWKRWIKNL